MKCQDRPQCARPTAGLTLGAHYTVCGIMQERGETVQVLVKNDAGGWIWVPTSFAEPEQGLPPPPVVATPEPPPEPPPVRIKEVRGRQVEGQASLF